MDFFPSGCHFQSLDTKVAKKVNILKGKNQSWKIPLYDQKTSETKKTTGGALPFSASAIENMTHLK